MSAGEDWDMPKSHYKGQWIGKTPMCAICAGPGEGIRAEHHMTHGIVVWLCESHRSAEFQRRRAGRDFVASLGAIWKAAGSVTRRHQKALNAHLRRVRPEPATRERPGSYAWAELRREAERRFARGQDPQSVIADLQQAAITGASRPSYRTLRRWFSEARWLHLTPAARTGHGRSTPAVGRNAPTLSRDHEAAFRVAATDGAGDAAGRPIRGPC